MNHSGYYGDALSIFNKDNNSQHKNAPTYWINKGSILENLGRYKEAQDCFKKAESLQQQPSASLFYNLGYVNKILGEKHYISYYKQVEEIYNKKKGELAIDLAWGYVLLAQAPGIGNHEEVLPYFIALDKKYENPAIDLGILQAVVCNLRCGKPQISDRNEFKDETIRSFFGLQFKIMPKNLKLLTAYAEYCYLKKDLLSAEQLYKEAKALSPNYVNALNGLGAVYLESKKYQEAQLLFENALRVTNYKNEAAIEGRKKAISTTPLIPFLHVTASAPRTQSKPKSLVTDDEVQIIEGSALFSRPKTNKRKIKSIESSGNLEAKQKKQPMAPSPATLGPVRRR